MEVFDIFLSHNSADKPAVEVIAHKLKDAGVEPWLDKWCLDSRKNLSIRSRGCPPQLSDLRSIYWASRRR